MKFCNDIETNYIINFTEDKEKSTQVAITETPITVAYLNEKVKEKIFQGFQINTDDYFREVRRALFTHMFSEEPICNSKYLAFCRRYERANGMFNRDVAEPKFDAWALIRGTSRIIFDYKRFFIRYPTCRDQVRYLREFLDIQVQVKDNLKP